ncbi:hypothetical protein M9458_050323, partial [Cirrhinus mrigala]
MFMDQRSPHKTDRSDQTVSRRDLKLGRMVVLTATYNVTKARQNRPDGGATANKSMKSLNLLNRQLQAQVSYVAGILASRRTKRIRS